MKLSSSKIKLALNNWVANLKYLAKHNLFEKELDLRYQIKDETIDELMATLQKLMK